MRNIGPDRKAEEQRQAAELYNERTVRQTIAALAAIDAELGLPDDGCNSPAQTLAEIRALKAKAEIAQSLARTVMADQTSHDTRAQDAARFRLLLDGPHNFGVFVCGEDGSPDDSISNDELTAALDGLLGA